MQYFIRGHDKLSDNALVFFFFLKKNIVLFIEITIFIHRKIRFYKRL